MSHHVTTLAQLGQKKRALPSSPFSPWKPGNAAIQSPAKKEAEGHGRKEEGIFQDCKVKGSQKDNDEQVTKTLLKEKQKSYKMEYFCKSSFAGVDLAQNHCTIWESSQIGSSVTIK